MMHRNVFEMSQWSKAKELVPMAEWWYNTTFCTAIGMCPYKALYSKVPPAINYQSPATTIEAVDNFIRNRVEVQRNRVEVQKLLKENLIKAQEKLQPYRQTTVSKKGNQKLSAKYYSPYKIVQKIGKVAFKLELPPGAKIHHTFHVSQLKKRLELRN